MKKFLWVIVATVFLAACEEEEEKVEILKEESFNFEDIDFKDNTDFVTVVLSNDSYFLDKIVISTESETLVFQYSDSKFFKNDNEISTVDVSEKKVNGMKKTNVEIHLSADDVKKVSEKHADLYSRTLSFEVSDDGQ